MVGGLGAWDRKRALGRFDRSWSGNVALAVGMPALVLLRAYRKLRKALRRGPDPVVLPEDTRVGA